MSVNKFPSVHKNEVSFEIANLSMLFTSFKSSLVRLIDINLEFIDVMIDDSTERRRKSDKVASEDFNTKFWGAIESISIGSEKKTRSVPFYGARTNQHLKPCHQPSIARRSLITFLATKEANIRMSI